MALRPRLSPGLPFRARRRSHQQFRHSLATLKGERCKKRDGRDVRSEPTRGTPLPGESPYCPNSRPVVVWLMTENQKLLWLGRRSRRLPSSAISAASVMRHARPSADRTVPATQS